MHNRYSEIQRKQIRQRPRVLHSKQEWERGRTDIVTGKIDSICRASRLVLPCLKFTIRRNYHKIIKVYLQAGRCVILVDA